MSIQAIKLLSFDLDNTLYDNRPVIRVAESKNKEYLSQEFKKQNIDFDFEEFLSIRNELMNLKDLGGNNYNNQLENLTYLRHQVLKRFCERLNDSEQICQTALDLFLQYRSQVSVPNEIIRLLNSLCERFVVVSVTNGNCDPYQTSMGKYFKKHYAPNHGFRAKPHQHMLETIKQDFDVRSENILHIGDQLDTDGKAAENANCQFYQFSPFELGQSVSDSCEQLIAHLQHH